MFHRLFCAVAIATALLIPAHAQTKLLRFPDIHGNQLVFTYGGDLWTASTAGGAATRLTAHPGMELFAKFSPDGKWIAFTGQYDDSERDDDEREQRPDVRQIGESPDIPDPRRNSHHQARDPGADVRRFVDRVHLGKHLGQQAVARHGEPDARLPVLEHQ